MVTQAKGWPGVAHDHTGSWASIGVVSSFVKASSRLAIDSLMKEEICNAASWGRMLVVLMPKPSCLV